MDPIEGTKSATKHVFGVLCEAFPRKPFRIPNMGRPRAPHGTAGAFRRHKDNHEPVCPACLAWKKSFDEDKRVAALPTITDEKAKRILSHYADPIAPPVADRPSKRAADEAKKRKKALKKKAKHRKIDPLHEALDNLTYVEDAMEALSAGDDADPTKIAALSKRKSELIREIVEYQGGVGDKPAVDPLQAMLSGGVDLGNVTRIGA